MSERLTEAEREALRDWWDSESDADTAGQMLASLDAAVERILAARVEQARAGEGRCAALFPCHPTPEYPCDHPTSDHRCALDLDHHGEHVTPGGWR